MTIVDAMFPTYMSSIDENKRRQVRLVVFLAFIIPISLIAMAAVREIGDLFVKPLVEKIHKVEKQVDTLRKSNGEVSRRLSEIEKRNLQLIQMATGRIPLAAPPADRRAIYRKSYLKFVKAELGSLPKVRQYWADGMKLPNSEIRCLALNIYHEAAKEPHAGMVAVGQVTLNRFQRGKWGNVCDSVYATAQFSWTLDPKRVKAVPEGPRWERSKKVARDVARGLRVEGLENAVFYHANYIPGPKWLHEVKLRHYIGAHLFYEQRGG